MSLFVFSAVLFAAFLHVLWNAVIRSSGEKLAIMSILIFSQAFAGLPVIFFAPIPSGDIWWWIVASAFAHFFYQVFLIHAYQYGDLSRVYPIARGGAPMFVLVFSLLFLQENLSQYEIYSILAIGFGIILMSLGALRNAEALRLVPLALCAAMATATYSIVDAIGVRMLDDWLVYLTWLLLIDAGLSAVYFGFSNKGGLLNISKPALLLGILGGVLSYSAYAIVLWAMTEASIPLVTALRESSVMFAVLVGILFFKEKIDMYKIVAMIVIALAMVAMRLIA